MNMELVNLMKLVELRCRLTLKTGKKLREKLVGGLILKMTTKQWISILWKVSGGYLKNYGKKT